MLAIASLYLQAEDYDEALWRLSMVRESVAKWIEKDHCRDHSLRTRLRELNKFKTLRNEMVHKGKVVGNDNFWASLPERVCKQPLDVIKLFTNLLQDRAADEGKTVQFFDYAALNDLILRLLGEKMN